MDRTSKLDLVIRYLSYVCLVAGLAIFGHPYLGQNAPAELSSPSLETVGLSRDSQNASTRDASRSVAKVPIESIQVGMRVPARNPEVTDAERASRVEPDWDRWVRLTLEMPKPDGSVLRMEMLRPEEWVFSQIGFVVVDRQNNVSVESLPAECTSADFASTSLDQPITILGFDEAQQLVRQIIRNDFEIVKSAISPLRPVFSELASSTFLIQHAGDKLGFELLGMAVQMDLPELGLTGEAVVESIEPFSNVATGPGQVVTATFHHESADAINLSIAGDSQGTVDVESIGTTSNHPFWSEDRQQFVEAGSLEIGERLVTHQGETKRVVDKLPRPGPEPVFNIEVWGEHVYYAGRSAALVHNTYPNDQSSAVRNVRQYGTPFSPLSSAQRKALKAKETARTIKKQEYQHLQWDKRFANRRAAGVRRFWAQERAALRAGEPGTRAWTEAQRADILAPGRGRTPKFNGESIEGHHLYNALDHPHIANEPWNIYPATKSEHFNRWHDRNWRNDTFGQPLNPLFPEDF